MGIFRRRTTKEINSSINKPRITAAKEMNEKKKTKYTNNVRNMTTSKKDPLSINQVSSEKVTKILPLNLRSNHLRSTTQKSTTKSLKKKGCKFQYGWRQGKKWKAGRELGTKGKRRSTNRSWNPKLKKLQKERT